MSIKTPWAWEDIDIPGALFGLFALAVCLFGVWGFTGFRGLVPAETRESQKSLLTNLSMLLMGLVFGWVPYSLANKHRLLRGECRFTVARVFEYKRSKSGVWSRLEFWVLGERYFNEQKAFARVGLLPVGSYWYVRYAVPDPDANEGTGIQVPDSVRVVPPTGWANLPQPVAPPAPEVPPSPAGPPAPVIPAAAPEPLTGPAASPVFRAPTARVDTVVRLFAAPAPLVPEHLPR